jgi:hypothetical protein
VTVRAQFPAVRSSLDLNFARTKRLDPRITFTRASTGTFVGADGLIKTAASGAARFDHNPATGESLGLLVEEARTNRLLYSTDFANAVWNASYGTLTSNALLAPDQTLTAALFQADGAGTGFLVSGLYQTFSGIAAGTALCLSVYVKNNNAATVRIGLGLLNNQFQATTYTFATNTFSGSAGTTGTAQSLGSGWIRIILSISSTLYSTTRISILPDSTNSVYLWGAQLETGSFPTSYIPTTTATVTRAADVASMTGTNFSSWYNQNAGTIFVESRPMQLASNANIVKLRETSVLYNNIMAFIATSGSNQYYVSALGLNVTSFSSIASYSISQFNKAAGGYSLNSFNAAINGTIGVADTSGNTPINIDGLGFGAALSQPGEGNSSLIVRRLAYYPVRLPNAQLQELTK